MQPYEKITWRQSSGIIIQATDGRIPLVRNNYDENTPEYKRKFPLWWKFPGGKLKGNETPTECAVREAKEETTLTLRPENLRVLKYERSSTNDHLLTIFGVIIEAKQLEEIKYPFRGITGETVRIFTFKKIWRMYNEEKFHPDHVKYLKFFVRKRLKFKNSQY